MKDIPITLGAIVLTVIVIIVVPVMTMADRFDTTAQTEVDAIVSDFVEEVRTTGKLTQEKYSQLTTNLDSLGYTFDVQMEIKALDENQRKKASQTAKDKIGENSYYSYYTSQIEEQLENPNGTHSITLKPGSIVSVKVINTNPTMAQQMKNFSYKLVGNDTALIVSSKAGMVQ